MISVLINQAGLSPDKHDKTRRIIKSFLKKKKIDGVEISVKFVGREEMHRLNKRYRKIDKPTTILTFSQLEEKEGQVSEKPLGNLKILGDIVICLEEAREQGLTLERLLKHGLRNLIKTNERSGLLSKISSSKNLRA